MTDDLPKSPTGNRADEDAIRKLLGRQVNGWDAGDPDAYASVFTSDADYVTFLGSHYKGREAIAASYAPVFKNLLRGSPWWRRTHNFVFWPENFSRRDSGQRSGRIPGLENSARGASVKRTEI
jgi:hypothetical protein